MEIKFKVQNCDDVMEIYARNKDTVDDFISEIRKYCPESLFPRHGIRNVRVFYKSHVLSPHILLYGYHNEILLVTWEECDAQIGHLCAMGFPRAQVIEALKAAKSNIQVALMNLKSTHQAQSANQPVWLDEDVNFTGPAFSCRHKSFSVFPCVSHCILPSHRRIDGVNSGLPNSQYNYAICLSKGIGVPVDEAAAAHYLELAANKGLQEAQFDYADCLEYGRGVSVDKTAADYCKRAADSGLPRAQHRYAIYLDNGIGVERNEREAATYYKLAADNGVPEAQIDYCLCLIKLKSYVAPLWEGINSPFFKLEERDSRDPPFRSAFCFPLGRWLRIYNKPSLEIRNETYDNGQVHWKAEVHYSRTRHPDTAIAQY